MLFRKKKKEELHKGDVFLAKGIYLKQPSMENGNIFLNCFLRCLIVFLLVFGSIGGFLSAFEISYNYLLVMAFYLVLSMYFSFLYASSKLLYRDIGYILFFGVFVVAIYLFRVYANSGFYAIVNRVLQHAKDFFELAGIREYETQITNDYLTVAIVAIFLGMVMIIILNIWIYSTMSLAWTVLFTFPLLMIPLYMKLTPDAFYMIALCVGYMAVIIFKGNGHYLAFAWDASFRIRGLKKDKVTYTQDAGIFKQLLLSVTALGFCMVILVNGILPANRFEKMFKNDRLREKTAESIGNFILLGFEGLYNQYSSTGGLSGGKLGGIANVRPDYQTDLLVSYAPYSNEAVYLKAYTGGVYRENEWESLYEEYGEDVKDAAFEQEAIKPSEESQKREDITVFEDESMRVEAESLQAAKAEGLEYAAFGRMDIKNVGAGTAYLYYPYYTVFEDYSVYDNHGLLSSVQGIERQETQTYYYYPKIEWEDSLGDILPEQIDTDEVDEVFLDVPDKNAEVIAQECNRIGLTEDMTENEIVAAVKDYFEENIPYTLKPGATPKKEDFINYFLTTNRKGYCAHFASAATLIFRQMGIPARYVEGYAFSMETVLASDINEEKEYADYYQGYSDIGTSAVMDVEVTDAMAHAWVEIYVEDFGWKVVEVTPGSNETTEEDDFWSAFSNFFSGGNTEGIGNTGYQIGTLKLSQYAWLVYVVLMILVVLLLVFMVRICIRKLLRYRKCHQKDKREAAIASYADICDRIRLCETDFALCRSHSEQLSFIGLKYQVAFDKKMICRWLEQISYSQECISEKELEQLLLWMRNIRKAIWKNVNWKKRVALYRR